MPPGDASTTITAPLNKSSAAQNRRYRGLLHHRVCLLPTWRGWALLLLLTVLFTIGVGRQLCAFLTVNDPPLGGVLVVEGWVPSYATKEAVEVFRRNQYVGIYATGEPTGDDTPYIGYASFADLTEARLLEAGAAPETVHTVPAPFVGKDRTYTMASALKKRLEADGVSTAKITVISVGPHSRRSRLLYQFAFGPNSQVGMIAVTDHEFDPDHWWRSSNGVRSVISEAIAYCYARFLFRPPAE
ncbi:MAG TPA: hypothetical protein VK961_06000 [Chthoniobacter sp.]|nr:hypothetical protein [Chthoniobacter sp.]